MKNQLSSDAPDNIAPEIDAPENFAEVSQGVTPAHRQNIDESRVDEVLIKDTLDDTHYPGIKDIADNEAVQHSHEDDL